MSRWNDAEGWRALVSGEACPICASMREEGRPRGCIAELEATYLTTHRGMPVRGYCCLVLRRHAVELHDLGDAEAEALMRDMRRVSEALQSATGAVKINVEIHGNTIPHLHVHFFPRYPGDRFEGGPIDLRKADPTAYQPDEFPLLVEALRSALG